MRVVCDSSTLINLSLLNQLHLLEAMYGGVFVPPGVYDEVVRIGAGRVGADEVRNAGFITVTELEDPEPVALYMNPLSEVDASVIVLAKEQDADLIITRDGRLRRRSIQEGLHAIHTFAFFIEAKQAGFIEAVKPLLDEMRHRGVRIRDGVSQEILRQAGEVPRGRRRRNVPD